MKILFAVLVLFEILTLGYLDHKEKTAAQSDDAQQYAIGFLFVIVILIITLTGWVMWAFLR